jgi:DNA-binding response OmpR family regulator
VLSDDKENRDKKVARMAARKLADDNQSMEHLKNRILVVDDDPSVLEMLTRVLNGENYLALAAASGPDALKIAAATQIDLVLLDLNMPGQSGWETFESLAAGHPLVPVIIMAARSTQLLAAMTSGAGALLEKPLDFPKLLQTISNLLAEPAETRLARMAGKSAEFQYLPPPQNAKSKQKS